MLDNDPVGINGISDKMNAFLLHTAENAGAIVKKTLKPSSNTYPWFDRECMSERQIYRKIKNYSDDDSLKHEASNQYRKFCVPKFEIH